MIQQIEQQFRDLIYQLRSGVGSRVQLSLIHQFLHQVHSQNNPQLYLSYYQEIYENFLDLFQGENLQFRSPEFLDELKTQCATMINSGLSELEDPAFRKSFEILEHQRIAVRFYTGDIAGALDCLHISDLKIKNNPDSTSYQGFQNVLTACRANGNPATKLLEKIDTEWQEMANGVSDNTVWIPLVENGHGSANQELTTATIQPLQVEVELRRRDATRDMIFFNNHPMGNSDLIYYQALDAIAVAKKQLKSKTGGKLPYFRVMFGFPETEYFYTGESFGLGMSLAALAQMEKITIQRTQHTILKNSVITGGVDINGKVREISEQSLPAKIEAFFYSPFQTFVHPENNTAVTEKTISLLGGQKQKPKSLAVDKIGSALKNESITKKKPINFREWSRAHVRKNQILRYAATILILVGIGWGSWFFSRDLNPVIAKVDHEYLYAYNQSGKQLWSYQFPFELNSKRYNDDREGRLLHTFDLDKDGMNEIIIGLKEDDGEVSGKVYCFDYDGQIKWLYDDHSQFQCNETLFNDYYNTIFVLPYKNGIVVCFGHYLYFPYQIVILNEFGSRTNDFWHPGQILGMMINHNENEGNDELLIWGTNNQFNEAILASINLDSFPQYLPGFSLKCQNLENSGTTGIKYIRFPKPGEYTASSKLTRPDTRSLNSVGNSKYLAMVYTSNDAFLLYTFDTKLDLLNFDISDSYYGLFHGLRDVNMFDIYNKREVWQHFTALQYWDGETWVIDSLLTQTE